MHTRQSVRAAFTLVELGQAAGGFPVLLQNPLQPPGAVLIHPDGIGCQVFL